MLAVERCGMFVQDFVEIAASEAAVVRLLTLPGWLAAQLDCAADDGCFVDVGPPRPTSGSVIVPVLWETTLPSGARAVLVGDFEIAALDDHRSYLTFAASYLTPSGYSRDDRSLRRLIAIRVRHGLTNIAANLHPIRAVS
jgi:hypothetical protein